MSKNLNNKEPEFRISFSLFITILIFTSIASLAISAMAGQLDYVDCSKPEKFSDVVKHQYGVGQEAIDYCNTRVEETRSLGSWMGIGLLFIPIITGIGYWRTNKGKRT